MENHKSLKPPPFNKTFRRNLSSRVLSSVVFVITISLLVNFRLFGNDAPLLTQLVLGFFALSSFILSIYNFGDRFVLDETGIAYTNVLIGRKRGVKKHVKWSDIESVKEYRGKTLFLFLREGGKKMVLDSIERYPELREIVRASTDDFSVWPQKSKIHQHRGGENQH